jgi:hypothetical protein
MSYDDKFDTWVDQWEKAQKDGLFKNAPKPVSPSPQTGDSSFFGLVNTNNSKDIRDVDAEYWNQLHHRNDPDPSIMSDAVDFQLTENKKANKVANAIFKATNPIRPNSTGEDQAMEPKQLGVIWSPDDLNKLSEMKVELEKMESKRNRADAEGRKTESVKSQLTKLRKEIDKLSNSMNTAYPNEIFPKGD